MAAICREAAPERPPTEERGEAMSLRSKPSDSTAQINHNGAVEHFEHVEMAILMLAMAGSMGTAKEGPDQCGGSGRSVHLKCRLGGTYPHISLAAIRFCWWNTSVIRNHCDVLRGCA